MSPTTIIYGKLEKTNMFSNITPKTLRNLNNKKLNLRGQMLNLKLWGLVVFLGTPVLPTLDFAKDIGLYLNDLPMHDFSRDNVLTGTQELSELRLSLETEQEKTIKLRESIHKLDEEMERTNRLLYQMIPQHVAEQLKAGEIPVTTCQMHACVSILLSDVVKFTEICSQLKPMNVVALLNEMYSRFDQLTEKHGVNKIETIGDAYMVVAGLQNEADHAVRVCNMALEMTEVMSLLRKPDSEEHLRIRVGISTGPAVAGIVGQKMPRYCLFGKAPHLATIMENSSLPMKIQLSEYTVEHLPHSFVTTFRCIIKHPKCSGMKTYWLLEKRQPEPITIHEFRDAEDSEVTDSFGLCGPFSVCIPFRRSKYC